MVELWFVFDTLFIKTIKVEFVNVAHHILCLILTDMTKITTKKSQGASALRLYIPCITHIGKKYDIGCDFIVLIAGRAHFGVFDGYFLCLFYFMKSSVRSCTIRNFWRVFLVAILLYSVLRMGRTQLASNWVTSGWVLVWSIRILPIGRQASFSFFSPKCVTYVT